MIHVYIFVGYIFKSGIALIYHIIPSVLIHTAKEFFNFHYCLQCIKVPFASRPCKPLVLTVFSSFGRFKVVSYGDFSFYFPGD